MALSLGVVLRVCVAIGHGDSAVSVCVCVCVFGFPHNVNGQAVYTYRVSVWVSIHSTTTAQLSSLNM